MDDPEKVSRAMYRSGISRTRDLQGSKPVGFEDWAYLCIFVQRFALKHWSTSDLEFHLYSVTKLLERLKVLLTLESHSLNPVFGMSLKKEYQRPDPILWWMLWKKIMVLWDHQSGSDYILM